MHRISLFSLIQRDGFVDPADKLIGVGAKYGRVAAADVFPCVSTVSWQLADIVAMEESKLMTHLNDAVKSGVTTDMWIHCKTNDSYITVTVQYVDSAWSVSSFVLAIHAVEDKHTAESICSNIKAVVEEFGVLREGNIFVTDNAAYMKAAFHDHT